MTIYLFNRYLAIYNVPVVHYSSCKFRAPLKGLIFDMDNTLYTHEAYAEHQELALLERLAREKSWTKEEAQTRLDNFRQDFAAGNEGKMPSLGNSFLALGVPIAQSAQWRNEVFRPEDFLSPDPRLGVELAALRESYSLAIVTNNSLGMAARTLECLGIAQYFHAIVGLDDTYKSKPAREPFELAAQRLGFHPNSCVSIGDRYPVDIEPALQLGMDGILVEGVDEIYSLRSILEGIYGIHRLDTDKGGGDAP